MREKGKHRQEGSRQIMDNLRAGNNTEQYKVKYFHILMGVEWLKKS